MKEAAWRAKEAVWTAKKAVWTAKEAVWTPKETVAVQRMAKAAPAVQTTKIVEEERARSLLMKSVEVPRSQLPLLSASMATC